MNYTIQNELLRVEVSDKGAELQSIYHLNHQLEYLWSGDSAFWGKKSPVLFPIVGGLKNNTYQYKGNTYSLSRHGFARDMVFELVQQTATTLHFSIQHTEDTLKVYPFAFRFSVCYRLVADKLMVTYLVENIGNDEMYFSVGAHPAFAVPLEQSLDFNDYQLIFEVKEQAGKYPLSGEGLVEPTAIPFLNSNTLPLSKPLFYHDALVFKQLQSKSITIQHATSTHGITCSFEGFPFMGIWSAKDADFVCIEPWCGIADAVNCTGKLSEKEGIHELAVNASFERTWSVSCF